MRYNNELDHTTDVELNLRHLRSLEGLRVERITKLNRSSLCEEEVEELVVDAFLHKDTRSSAANLTMIPAEDAVSFRS